MKTCTELSSCTPKRRSTPGPAARPIPYAQRSPASANAHATRSTSGRLNWLEVAAAAAAASSTISPEEGRPKLSPNAPMATPRYPWSCSRESALGRSTCFSTCQITSAATATAENAAASRSTGGSHHRAAGGLISMQSTVPGTIGRGAAAGNTRSVASAHAGRLRPDDRARHRPRYGLDRLRRDLGGGFDAARSRPRPDLDAGPRGTVPADGRDPHTCGGADLPARAGGGRHGGSVRGGEPTRGADGRPGAGSRAGRVRPGRAGRGRLSAGRGEGGGLRLRPRRQAAGAADGGRDALC